MRTWKAYISSLARIHRIIDYYGSHIRIRFAVHLLMYVPGHISIRLISYHFAINSWTNWAFDPVCFSFQHFEALTMDQMTAIQHDDVITIFLNQFFFKILFVLKLKLANTALVFFRVLSSKPELKGWKVRMRDNFI